MLHKSRVFPSVSSLVVLVLSLLAQPTNTKEELPAVEKKCIAENLDALGKAYAWILNYDGISCRDEGEYEMSPFDYILKGERPLNMASYPMPCTRTYNRTMVEFRAAAKRLFMLDNTSDRSTFFGVIWPSTNASLAADGDLQPLGGEGGKTGSARFKHLRIPEIMIKRRLKPEEEANLMNGLLVKVGSHIGQQALKGANTRLILTLGLFRCNSPDGVQAYTVQERVGGKMARLRKRSPHSTKPHSVKDFDFKGLWYTNDDLMRVLHEVITDRLAYTVINNTLGRGLLDGMVTNHQEGHITQMEATLEFLTNLKQDTEFLGSVTQSQDYSWFAISEELDATVENEEMCKASNGILVRTVAEAQKNWMTNYTEKHKSKLLKRPNVPKLLTALAKENNAEKLHRMFLEMGEAYKGETYKERSQHASSFVKRVVCKRFGMLCSGLVESNSEPTTTTNLEIKSMETPGSQTPDWNHENGKDQMTPDTEACASTTLTTTTVWHASLQAKVSIFCVHNALIDFYGGFGEEAKSESYLLGQLTTTTYDRKSFEKFQRAIVLATEEVKKEVQDLEKEVEAQRKTQASNDDHNHDTDDQEDAEESLNKLHLIGQALETASKYVNANAPELQQTQMLSESYSERLYSTVAVQLFRLGDVMEKYNEQ